MRMYMFHGRLQVDSPGTDLDGNPVDDWGFEGPSFDCTGISVTYGNYSVHFQSEADLLLAQNLTGWRRGVHDLDLELPPLHDDLLAIYNVQRERAEYFGDWGLK